MNPYPRIVAWSAVEALPVLTGGLLVGAALDHGFLAGRTGAGLLLIAGLGLLHLLGGFATRQLFGLLAAVVEPLRDRLLTGVVDGGLHRAVAGRPADGGAVARLTMQVESARNLTSALLRSLRQGAVTLVAAMAGLALVDPVVALPTAGCVLVAAVLYGVVLRHLSARYRDEMGTGEDLAAAAATVFGGIRDVVAADATGRAAADLDAAVSAHARAALRSSHAVAARTVVVAVGGYLPLLLLLMLLPAQMSRGTLTVGEAVGAATYLVTRLLPAITTMTAVVGPWLAELVVVRRRLREASAVPGVPAGGHRPAGEGGLVLRDVTFRFGPYADPLIDGLTLSLPADSHLAVVGASGAGKSTLTRLITGELVPESGTVELAGVPVRELRRADLHRHVAVIPQEAYVFAGTLAENLRYLAPDAGGAELDRACAVTGLDATVRELGGYDARVGPGGAALSDGARQLVAVTRAYLSPARVVVLDEATSHLDVSAEGRIEEAFRRRGGLLIVIAHRLESAHRAPRILLLGARRAVAGSHDELAARSADYRELVG